MLVLVSSNDLGSGLLYYGIFLSMLYVATARLSFVVVGIALFVAGGVGAYEKIPHVQRARHDLAAPVDDAQGVLPERGDGHALRQDCQSYQLVKSLYSIANGGFGGAGLGKGTFTTTDGKALIPYVNSDFIYSALAQELGLDRRRRAAARLHAVRRARDEGRAAGRRRLLEAARRGAHVRLRAADVHHRRRRAARDPADRDHAAVRLVRRLVRRRELRAARGPPPRLPSGEHANERADLPPCARRARPAQRAHRRDDVLAGVGRSRASPRNRTTRSSASRSSGSGAG